MTTPNVPKLTDTIDTLEYFKKMERGEIRFCKVKLLNMYRDETGASLKDAMHTIVRFFVEEYGQSRTEDIQYALENKRFHGELPSK